jgi:hypothetical protein
MGLLSREEGLDPLTKLGGAVLLKYIAGSQKDFKKMLGTIWTASNYFEHTLGTLLRGPELASYEEMLELGVMKKKYIPYSAYMAAISAYPLLSRVASQKQLLSTILAKMALILSIKVLDNINDTFHTTEEAVDSLQRQASAIIYGIYATQQPSTPVKKSENSCILLALLVNKWLKTAVPTSKTASKIFLDDLRKYIDGQRSTFLQQNAVRRNNLTIRDYLQQINEKGVGRIWVGLDLCMMEHLCAKNEKTYKGFQLLRKGFDYVFKSSNYYDDVADLEADLSMGIWNSVVYLGIDMGLLKKPEEALKSDRAKKMTIRLGDLHYLIGLSYLRHASKYLPVNEKSLLASMAVFRFFTARKWFFKSPNISNFVDFLKSKVPDELQPYINYI